VPKSLYPDSRKYQQLLALPPCQPSNWNGSINPLDNISHLAMPSERPDSPDDWLHD